MSKEFKTVEQQVDILRNRGLVIDESAEPVLLRENYYSIINGYKEPFLDVKAMQKSPGDIYLPGTKFDWLYSLFLFDRELRSITFSYLIQAESALKTATVYAFCSRHPGHSDYLDRQSFVEAKDMLVAKSFSGDKRRIYSENLGRLIALLNGKQTIRHNTRPFVAHYLERYGNVPLWVLANDLTFGNVAHFYQLMLRGDQNSVCKVLYKTTERVSSDKRIFPHDVLRAYEVLVFYRNLCAHDERLYCAKMGSDTYASIFAVLPTALPMKTVEQMKVDIEKLLQQFASRLHGITADDMGRMLGIGDARR